MKHFIKKYLNLSEILNLFGILTTSTFIWLAGVFLKKSAHPLLTSVFFRVFLIGLLFIFWLLKIGIRVFIEYKSNKKTLNNLVKNSEQLHETQLINKTVLKKSLLLLIQEIKRRSVQYNEKKMFFSEIPCFCIIGSPQSGKTSILNAAQVSLSFIEPHFQTALQNLHKIDAARWWFTQEALFLEIDIPKGEPNLNATPLLNALKQLRRYHAFNGLIIVEDINHIMSLSDEDYHYYSKNLHQYLRTLYAFFGLHLPIHILFNKADLIPGFKEYFLNFNKKELEKVFGYSVEASEPHTIQKKVAIQHELLTTHLENDLVYVLSHIKDTNEIALAVNFPKKIFSLKQRILDYLHDVFDFQQTEKPYELQGIYFGSIVLPAPSKINNPALIFKENFHNPLESSYTEVPSKSYFLSDFLKKYIFISINKVIHNKNQKKIKNFIRRSVYTVTLLLIISYIIFSIQNYLKITTQTKNIVNVLENYPLFNALTYNANTLDHNLISVLPYLDPFEKAISIYENDFEWYQPYTMYELFEIKETLNKTVDLAINKIYVPALFKRVEFLLEQEKDDPEQIICLLKAYLSFKNPSLSSADLKKIFVKDINSTYIHDQETAKKLLNCLEIALKRPFPNLNLNTDLIRLKHSYLNNFDPVQRAYNHLKTVENPSKSFFSIFPKPFITIFDQVFTYKNNSIFPVSYLFTIQGYKEIFQVQAPKLIEEISQAENIIFSNSTIKNNEDKAQLLQKLETLYFQDYLHNWQEFLKNLQLVFTPDLNTLSILLNSLAGKENFLEVLINFVKQQLSIIPSELINDTYKEVIEFSNLTNDNKVDELKNIIIQMNQLAKLLPLSSSNSAALNFLKSIRAEDISHPFVILNSLTQFQPTILKEWMVNINERIKNLMIHENTIHLDQLWQHHFSFYEKNILNTYPITENSTQFLHTQDFKKFFGPQGILEDFIINLLKPLCLIKYKTNESGIITKFEHSLDIYKKFFDDKDQLSFLFQLQPFTLDKSLSSLTVNFIDNSFTYRHGPLQKQMFNWKNPEAETDYLEISVIDFDQKESKLRFDGPWMFFKFLDFCTIKPYKQKSSYLLTFYLNKHKIQLILYSSKIIEFLKEIRSQKIISNIN